MGKPARRTGLLILDAVNTFDFDGAQDLAAPAIAATEKIVALRAAADRRGVPVIYVNDNYGHWGSERSELVRRTARQSDTAAWIIERLAPRTADYFVIKPHFSGFYATNLTALLDTLEIGRLVLTGFAADICVLFTAADAHMRGYELWVPADTVASETAERQRWALEIMTKSMQATTETTDDLMLEAWLEEADAGR